MIGLVYAKRGGWTKWPWVAEAFGRLGHEIVHLHSIADVLAADLRCDLVLFEQYGAGLNDREIITNAPGHKAVWAQWWFDLVCAVPNTAPKCQPLLRNRLGEDTSNLLLMQVMDLVGVKEAGHLAAFAEMGIGAVYWDQGCPKQMPACTYHENPEFDVVLWGQSSGQYRQRREDAKQLAQAGFAVGWAGASSGSLPLGVTGLPYTPWFKLPELISRANVVLCVDARHDIEGYWSDRLWLALGAGGNVLRRITPGLPLGPYQVYSSHKQMVAYVRRLCQESATDRLAVGMAARQWVMTHHTYDNRCQEILEWTSTSAENAKAPALSG